MFTEFQYRLLRTIAPREPKGMDGSAYTAKSKLQIGLGDELVSLLRGKTVIDFGCGEGLETLNVIRAGATHVIGLDLREDLLAKARGHAAAAGLSDRCEFTTSSQAVADVIISLDAFEHFGDPAAVLDIMH